MFNPDTAPVSTYMPSFETAARSLKVVPITVPVHSDEEIETAITALGREPGGGLVALSGAFLLAHRAPIILAATRNNVRAAFDPGGRAASATFTKTMGIVRSPLDGSGCRGPVWQPAQPPCERSYQIDVTARPTRVHPHIATVSPSQVR